MLRLAYVFQVLHDVLHCNDNENQSVCNCGDQRDYNTTHRQSVLKRAQVSERAIKRGIDGASERANERASDKRTVHDNNC